MSFDLDLSSRVVLVVGDAQLSRRALAEAVAGGARVTSASASEALSRLGAIEPAVDLLVWVDGPQGTRDTLAALARELRIPFATAEPVAPTPHGQVTLVGGGPGDPDLITIAGRRALARADVVLHDRLGPRDALPDLAPGAELIDVGKTPGHHAVPQREIERIMVEKARSGLRVVRLKGGDPFVFGRGGEEVAACHRAGVPVHIVPGVTSAIAVPAEAGIPVTHREISRAFTVISGHVPLSEEELSHAVGLGGTLVVLMGVATLPHLSAGLRRHGMRDDMPVAVLERGFTESRRTTVTTISGVLEAVTKASVRSPAVIVIGEVVTAIADAANDVMNDAGDADLVAAIHGLA
ncbi:uroporphyrinogen-III C-methyltransferase [Leifsonia sp. NPDC058292]|uniref:uroporphyrinogen-III C-methyltransferase n=1 Tax=Leifsonia sp. NPDC058292 TaxID=3346428 RepID=UPI0036D94D15